MRTVRKVAFLNACCILFGAASYAAEKPVSRAELPPAVQKTIDEQSKGAAIKRFVKDNEDGQLEYEAEMIVDGHSKDISVAPDGRLIEIEEQVDVGNLPPDVRSGLAAKAGRGTITKIESIKKRGTIVAYEAQVMTAGRHSEIQVGPNGQGLDHEE